jgi:hypothetical protein
MTDLRKTIIPKSDQLNADDLIGTTKTIKINKVFLAAGEQPIAINYDGDGGKPYLPCKSMRRVLVNVWGSDGNAFVGRSLTLYRDDKVQFGGLAVGGIRISHMSHIDKDVTMALTATRANRKPFTVKPLIVTQEREDAPAGKISAQQGKELRELITINKIDPASFLAEFGITSSADLPADKMDAAKEWIKKIVESSKGE